MIAVILIVPAFVCAGLAWAARTRLRELAWMSWMGSTLLGVGVPVLIGQVAAWVMVSSSSDGVITPEQAYQIQRALAAGLAGGLGFGAGSVSARITAPQA